MMAFNFGLNYGSGKLVNYVGVFVRIDTTYNSKIKFLLERLTFLIVFLHCFNCRIRTSY